MCLAFRSCWFEASGISWTTMSIALKFSLLWKHWSFSLVVGNHKTKSTWSLWKKCLMYRYLVFCCDSQTKIAETRREWLQYKFSRNQEPDETPKFFLCLGLYVNLFGKFELEGDGRFLKRSIGKLRQRQGTLQRVNADYVGCSVQAALHLKNVARIISPWHNEDCCQ